MSHTNLIIDADPHFSIDPITRKIKNESSKKVTLIQNDHNSERFTFDIPRYIEEHDMMECDRVEVHFVNGANASLYLVNDMQIHPEDESKVAFSWLVQDEATKNVGRLEFQIRFCCTNEDNIDDYIWHTAINADISISSGMNNTETVVERVPDVIAELAWKTKAIGDLGKLDTTNKTSLVAAINEIDADCDSRQREMTELMGVVYHHNDTLNEMTKPPETTVPTTLEVNTSYNFGHLYELSLSFPQDANDGDVIHIAFVSGDIPTNLIIDTTNTSNIDLVPEAYTIYEMYAKFNSKVGSWLANYSEWDLN